MLLAPKRYADRITKRTQVKFGGLNHSIGAGDGELWDMRNLTSDQLPLLASRSPRWKYGKLSAPGGIYAWEMLCWVDGTDFYYDGEVKGQVEEGEKIFCCLTPYIVILPDKAYYNVQTGEFGSLESSVCVTGIYLYSKYSVNGQNANYDCLWRPEGQYGNYFRVGDTVTISGCTVEQNNISATIREIDSYGALCFDGGIFTVPDGGHKYQEAGEVTIARTVPDLKFICENESRLWGCTDTGIFCCKLGDPFNWNTHDLIDSDSWNWHPGSAGVFTGCVAYGGYPIFFKENQIFKVYGSYPSNYEVLSSATLGLAAGSHGSFAVAGEVLFYLSRSGICAYTGGIPQPMSKAFGNLRFHDAVAGSDGLKYYVSMRTGDGDWRLYVYDTQQGAWHIEDDRRFTHFATVNGDLLGLAEDGAILMLGNPANVPEDAVQEDPISWMAEFGDFTGQDPNKKGMTKLQLRLELEEGATMQVYLQFDSDGVWHKVNTVVGEGRKRSYYLPIVPRRTDHYRLKLEGTGGCILHSLVAEAYSGSELRAREGRN